MIGSALVMMLAAQGASAPAALKPDGAWQMDGQRCALSRKFQSDAGPVTFGVNPNIGAPGGELVLVLPGRPTGRYEVDEGKIVVGDGGPSFPAVWSRVGRRDQTFNGVTIQPADRFWSTLSTASLLTLDVGKRQQMRFDLGPMGAVAATLEKCRSERAALIKTARAR